MFRTLWSSILNYDFGVFHSLFHRKADQETESSHHTRVDEKVVMQIVEKIYANDIDRWVERS